MIKSIFAGFMIALVAGIYLVVEAPLGAFMFSLGLLTILYFKANLFTGKAGLLTTKDISFKDLSLIWVGNFIGCIICALLFSFTTLGSVFNIEASRILMIRVNNLWFENIILGIFCGIFMYIGVRSYVNYPYITILCVASFILLGTNHCVADMAYLLLANNKELFFAGFLTILETTLGNIIGTNLIPLITIYTDDCCSDN